MIKFAESRQKNSQMYSSTQRQKTNLCQIDGLHTVLDFEWLFLFLIRLLPSGFGGFLNCSWQLLELQFFKWAKSPDHKLHLPFQTLINSYSKNHQPVYRRFPHRSGSFPARRPDSTNSKAVKNYKKQMKLLPVHETRRSKRIPEVATSSLAQTLRPPWLKVSVCSCRFWTDSC